MNNIISLNCKNCGAKLVYDEKEDKYICESCDSEFLIDRTNREDTFTVKANILTGYNGTASEITVPRGIKIIGADVFKGMETVISVSLPDSVVSVEDGAFEDCTGLKSVSFPDGIKKIGKRAFKNSGLKTVVLPEGIDSIGEESFMQCEALVSAKLPRNPELIYQRTFKLCKNLTDVSLDLNDFCLSFRPSIEAARNGDKRSTLFDAFQATPFFTKLQGSFSNRICIKCGSEINSSGNCENCGSVYPDAQKKGCYIATAVYGSYNCPEVWTLRRYRDEVLSEKILGRAFIRVYYSFSPLAVRMFKKNGRISALTKKLLDGIVCSLNKKGIRNAPYSNG